MTKRVENFQFQQSSETYEDGFYFYTAYHTVQKKKYTLKRLNTTGNIAKQKYQSLLKEVSILKQLDHPNIIKCHKMLKTSNNIYLVFDYHSDTTLQTLISQGIDNISMQTRQSLIKQIYSALIEMQKKRIVHLNLTPKSIIIINQQNQLVPKISGFIYGDNLGEDQYVNISEAPQKSQYTAPQTIQNRIGCLASDAYSFGKLMSTLQYNHKVTLSNSKQIQDTQITAIIKKLTDKHWQKRQNIEILQTVLHRKKAKSKKGDLILPPQLIKSQTPKNLSRNSPRKDLDNSSRSPRKRQGSRTPVKNSLMSQQLQNKKQYKKHLDEPQINQANYTSTRSARRINLEINRDDPYQSMRRNSKSKEKEAKLQNKQEIRTPKNLSKFAAQPSLKDIERQSYSPLLRSTRTRKAQIDKQQPTNTTKSTRNIPLNESKESQLSTQNQLTSLRNIIENKQTNNIEQQQRMKQKFQQLLLDFIKQRNLSLFLLDLANATIRAVVNNNLSTILSYILIKKSVLILEKQVRFLQIGKDQDHKLSDLQRNQFFKTNDYFHLNSFFNKQAIMQRKWLKEISKEIISTQTKQLLTQKLKYQFQTDKFDEQFLKSCVIQYLQSLFNDQRAVNMLQKKILSDLSMMSQLLRFGSYESLFDNLINQTILDLNKQTFIQHNRQMESQALINGIRNKLRKTK